MRLSRFPWIKALSSNNLGTPNLSISIYLYWEGNIYWWTVVSFIGSFFSWYIFHPEEIKFSLQNTKCPPKLVFSMYMVHIGLTSPQTDDPPQQHNHAHSPHLFPITHLPPTPLLSTRLFSCCSSALAPAAPPASAASAPPLAQLLAGRNWSSPSSTDCTGHHHSWARRSPLSGQDGIVIDNRNQGPWAHRLQGIQSSDMFRK